MKNNWEEIMERRQTGPPAGKLNPDRSVDFREQTIRQFMDRGVPRWKAEQMVFSSHSFEETERRKRRHSSRDRQLRGELHGSGNVGQAFKTLCDAGCDAEWLESTVLSLQIFPMRRKRKAFNATSRRCLLRIGRNLEHEGRELAKFRRMMLVSTITDWPVPREELPSIVEGIGYCLKQVAASRSWEGLTVATAGFQIPYVIEQIKHFTGRPHYADMATLIGATYGRSDYSEDELKMLVRRTTRRPK